VLKNNILLKSFYSNNKLKFKIFYLIIGVFFFIIICIKLFFYLDGIEEKREVINNFNYPRISPTEIAKIQEGDFILRRGFGFFSDVIATQLNKAPFDVTHAGIIVNDHGKWAVVHSLSSDVSKIDGIQIQYLDEFLKYSQSNKIVITRFKSPSTNTNSQIAGLAKYHLKKKISFDHLGDFEDSTSMYCTELILHILNKDLKVLEIDKTKQEKQDFLFTMKKMYDTNYFKLVVNTYPPYKE
jgi:hypothetical protein